MIEQNLISVTLADGQYLFSCRIPKGWGREEWIGMAACLMNHCARNAGCDVVELYEEVRGYLEPMRDILVDHGKGN